MRFCYTSAKPRIQYYVVVQFSTWFKYSFLFFFGIVMYDNDFETKENKI